MTPTKLSPPFCEECGEDIDLTVDPGARDAPIAWCEVCKPRRASVTIFLHAPDAYAFNSFMRTAGSWCGYWASSMEASACHLVPMHRLITAAPEDSPDERVYRVTPQRIAEAVLELFVAGDSGIGVRNIVRLRSFYESKDCCVIDCADEADRILQQACFGKIVYG